MVTTSPNKRLPRAFNAENMTRANPAITPSYRAQLGADLERLQRCSTLSQVRDLGEQYGVAARQKIFGVIAGFALVIFSALKARKTLVGRGRHHWTVGATVVRVCSSRRARKQT
jgi:hypothetical protein